MKCYRNRIFSKFLEGAVKIRCIVLFAVLLAGAASVLCLTSPARAATLTWDASGTGGQTDGGGSWTLAGSNWYNGTTFGAWVNSNSNVAQFGYGSGSSTPYIVTLSQATTANGIVFQNQAYTVNSNTLTLAGSTPTITMNASSGTIGSIVAGTSGLTLTGTGVLTLNGANTYTGGTMVNSGTLSFAGVSPSSGTITTAPGAVTQLAYPSSVNNSGTVTYAGSGTVVKTGAGTYEGGSGVQGIINMSAGGLIDVEQGAWWSNSYSNQIPTTNRGSLKVASGATFYTDNGANGSATFDVLTGSGTVSNAYSATTLYLGAANGTGTWSGVIAGGNWSVNKTGTGAETFSNVQTYTGGTTVSGGTLSFAGVPIPAGTVNTVTGAMTQLATGNSQVNSSNTVTYTGGGTLQKTGTSLFYTNAGATINMSPGGLLDIEQGTWQSTSWNTVISTSNSGSLKVASGASLTMDGSSTGGNVPFDALNGGGSILGPYTSSTLVLGVAGGSGTWAGVIGAPAHGGWVVNKTGTGTEVFSAVQGYTGGTTVLGGTLALAVQNTLSSASAITVAGGAVLLSSATSNNTQTINSLLTLNGGTLAAGSGSAVTNYYQYYLNTGGSITAGNNAISTITAGLSVYGANVYTSGNGGMTAITVNGGSTLNISGNMGGVSGISWGGIAKYGTGLLNLTGNNGGLGEGMYLSAGTVEFANNSLGPRNGSSPNVSYAADIEGNATLVWAPGNTQDISSANGSSQASQMKIADGVTATLNPGGNNVTLATAFTLGTNKTAALAVAGSGSLTLNAANSYSGGTTVTGFALQLGNASAMGATSGSLGISGGTLNMATYSPTVAAVSISNALIQGSGTLTGAGYSVSGGTIASVLAGSNAPLSITGGLNILGGANTYTGATTISGGTTVLASGASLSSSTSVNATSTLAFAAGSTGLTNANNLTLNGGRLLAVQDNSGTGGTIVTNGVNVTHTFNSSGTLGVVGTVSAAELIVGGGASGGGGESGVYYAAGGGGGQVLNLAATNSLSGSVLVTVGSGGVLVGGNSAGVSGGSSSIGGNTAAGGSGPANNTGVGGTCGDGTHTGGGHNSTAAGGGGGAGGNGNAASSSSVGGAGGTGLLGTITGSYYGGGGGGWASSTGGTGGLGGGGAYNANGTANTGGGGGGSGNGGSGLVVVQYAYNPFALPGAVTLNGNISVQANSSLDAYTSGGSLTVNGLMSGTGGITVFSSSSAGGVVTYTNANTYSGNTLVSSGATLKLSNNQALQNSTLDTSARATLPWAAASPRRPSAD